MKRSEHRILTTHAGSLPRPAELTSLFARRSVGEAVDERAIETLGRAAVCDIVRRQIEAGLDVIDDGEQSRESFVLYMRRRLTGLGGSGARPMHADLDAYPQSTRARSSSARPPASACRTAPTCRRRLEPSAIRIHH